MAMRLQVTSATKTATFGPEEVVVIGRREDAGCQFGLDPKDTTISRRAVTLHFDRLWWIINTSSHQRVRVAASPGEGETLAFNQQRALDRDRLTVIVYGRARAHRVVVSVPAPDVPDLSVPAPADPRATITEIISLTEAERDALVAVLHEYLAGPEHREPRPESYAEAATLLGGGVGGGAVRKRFEHVVDRLRFAGVPGLEGEDLRRATAQFLVVNGMLTPRDLTRLRRRS